MNTLMMGTVGLIMALPLVWYVLQVIADWKIFTKAGEAGWKSLIPIYNIFVEYQISWSGLYGLLFLVATFITGALRTGENSPTWMTAVVTVAAIAAAVLHFVQSVKLAKSFGKGTFYGVLLFLLGPICRIFLGLGSDEYIGPQ
jgi:hypothetical protein